MPDIGFPTSPTLGSLQPSLTLGITSKAKAMVAAGQDVRSLSAGEPDFDTPEHIKDACALALAQGETKYSPVAGLPALREAIAAKLSEENGIPCRASQVVAAPGAKFSVFSAVGALCGPGDEVVLPVPYWLSYSSMVKAAGATPVFLETRQEEGFCLDPDALDAVVTDRTKLLILNSPANPTGGVYSRDVIERIAETACRRNFMVLTDEIYEKLVFDPAHEHVSLASLGEEAAARTIVVNGFSKAYAMTGWRLGYSCAPEWLARRITALQSHSTSGPTTFVQYGALAALQGPQEQVAAMCRAFARRRDLVCELLERIPGLELFRPLGTFYAFPDIAAFGLDSMTFAERCLEEGKLAVIPGKPFGTDRHVRVSFAYDEAAIREGCERLAAFCQGLSKGGS